MFCRRRLGRDCEAMFIVDSGCVIKVVIDVVDILKDVLAVKG